MIRIVLGVLLAIGGIAVAGAPRPEQMRSDQIAGATEFVIGIVLVYFGARARRRKLIALGQHASGSQASIRTIAHIVEPEPQPTVPVSERVGHQAEERDPRTVTSTRAAEPAIRIGRAIDITRRDWGGLPWDVDPSTCRESDWRSIVPGTYFLAKIEDGWVYIAQGSMKYKLDEGDFRAHWPRM